MSTPDLMDRFHKYFTDQQIEKMVREEEARKKRLERVAEIKKLCTTEEIRHRDRMYELRSKCPHDWQEESVLDGHDENCSPSMGGCGCSYDITICSGCGSRK